MQNNLFNNPINSLYGTTTQPQDSLTTTQPAYNPMQPQDSLTTTQPAYNPDVAMAEDQKGETTALNDLDALKPIAGAKTETMPTAPDIHSMQGLGQFAIMAAALAFVAAGTTRDPMIAGADALGAALKGYADGHNTLAKEKMAEFKGNFQKAFDDNKTTIAKYNALIADRKTTIDQKKFDIMAYAQMSKDPIMYQEAKTGGIRAAAALLNARTNAMGKLNSEYLKIKENKFKDSIAQQKLALDRQKTLSTIALNKQKLQNEIRSGSLSSVQAQEAQARIDYLNAQEWKLIHEPIKGSTDDVWDMINGGGNNSASNSGADNYSIPKTSKN